jgi:hypothetical protein
MSMEREKMTEKTIKETEETQKLLRLKAGYGRHTSPQRNPPSARFSALSLNYCLLHVSTCWELKSISGLLFSACITKNFDGLTTQ